MEDELIARLERLPNIDVVIISNLYDLKPTGETIAWLRKLDGDLIVMTWLYGRAAHWSLDRYGIRGNIGESLLDGEGEQDDADDETGGEAEADKERVADTRDVPNRFIYCLDLRWKNEPAPFIEEVERIAAEARSVFSSNHAQPQIGNGNGNGNGSSANAGLSILDGAAEQIDEKTGRRWYPVIDFGRCTNCMECIDFCLFGVYGVDNADTILVEQPDNCRKGCPACSRVCPENAIIFPQHKTPAIAGAAVESTGLKIDLSKLFGAPDGGEDAATIAARERDEQLMLAGREAVGQTVGIAKRQEGREQGPKDDLDDLVDQLDDLEL